MAEHVQVFVVLHPLPDPQDDIGSPLRPPRAGRLPECEALLSAGPPFHGSRLRVARRRRAHRDLTGNHERRVEAHAEPAYQLGGHSFRFLTVHQSEEVAGARARDRAEVRDQLVGGHAHTVVRYGEGPLFRIDPDHYAQLVRARVQVGVAERLEPEPVERVGSVRYQLTKEHVGMRVQAVYDDVQYLPRLRSELELPGAPCAVVGVSGHRAFLPFSSGFLPSGISTTRAHGWS